MGFHLHLTVKAANVLLACAKYNGEVTSPIYISPSTLLISSIGKTVCTFGFQAAMPEEGLEYSSPSTAFR
ncbi:hypothetical protein SK128_007589, partial [Halocaridina rubra]